MKLQLVHPINHISSIMHIHLLAFLFFVSCFPPSSSSSTNVLNQGSSLFVKSNDLLVSQNHVFTAGFHQVGQNAFCFAVWFSEPMFDGNYTLVWMANRGEPVNGKRSKFSLEKTGNLVLKDVGRRVWTTSVQSTSSVQLQLLDSGNLVLAELGDEKDSYLWQSFCFPTDTILPNQPFTKDTVLVSSRSLKNSSSGFYKLYFDNDNVIRLLYSSDKITSVYWPSPWLTPFQAMRTIYNNSRLALLDSIGHFKSTDDLSFFTKDYGQTLQRRMTLDVDGNVRVYTLDHERRWVVSWQAIPRTCQIHGICGLNSLCTYSFESGRRCMCIHGYRVKNHSDLSSGCDPVFDLRTGRPEDYDFVKLQRVEFYGFDSGYMERSSLKACRVACLNDSNCKAFQYTFDKGKGYFTCYTKPLLFNGNYLGTHYTTYLKLPKTYVSSYRYQNVPNDSGLECSSSVLKLQRIYERKHTNGSLKFMLWFSIILGVIELVFFVIAFYITQKPSGATVQNYLAVATGFRRYTYEEITKATRGFREEIGRGGGGIVYKGTLPDNRVVAMKQLHEASSQGEDEFLAEISTIGRIHHRNLIETYGYCAEGKHRILVYEYMDNGSLAANLRTNMLDWQKRFEIATGVAKGLAYLHEECLEWVLHCDVKPHNILLDAGYNPKVADFGLSKLFHRDTVENLQFSRMRGTRGYMAPEWLFNLPITSKVDVYSYGMVVLEMITGRSPTCDDNERVDQKRLVSWVKEKAHEANDGCLTESEIMEILDPMIRYEYEQGGEMVNLLKVALQCVEEDKNDRPTMSEVVAKLLHSEIDG